MFGVAVRADGAVLAAAAARGLALQLHGQRHVVDVVCRDTGSCQAVLERNTGKDSQIHYKLHYKALQTSFSSEDELVHTVMI